MSTNKHAIIRYQTLDKCFRNSGRNYSIEDLIEECNRAIYDFTGLSNGIKKRQLYDDIRFMESSQGWNVEIKKLKDGRRVFYKYENPKFSISNQPLNETEATQLREALLTLNRFKGLPQFQWINELNTRLTSSFNLDKNSRAIIKFEENEFLKGLEFIPELYNAILYKKTLNIAYKSFKSETSTSTIISPYFLKQYNMRWFIFGKSNEYETITNLALDRILSIKITNEKYVNTDVNFNEYFDDVIGVTIPVNHLEKIILEIDDNLLPYLKTKPIHGSQVVKTLGGKHYLQIKVIPNYELEMLILSHGEKIKVIEPKELVEKIKDRIEKMKKNY